jgi:hypothetical protein
MFPGTTRRNEGRLLVEEELLALSVLVHPLFELLILDENVVRTMCNNETRHQHVAVRYFIV